jgi:hypothetical protein
MNRNYRPQIRWPLGKEKGQFVYQLPEEKLRWIYRKAFDGEPLASIVVNNAIADILEMPRLYLTTEMRLPNGREIVWQSIKTLTETDYASDETPEAIKAEIARVLKMGPKEVVARPEVVGKPPISTQARPEMDIPENPTFRRVPFTFKRAG